MLEPESKNKASIVTDNNTTGGIHYLFEQIVSCTPNATAVNYRDISLTYRQLNERSNQLAHFLKHTQQITSNQPVGIMLGRSEKMLVGILAILKAGGAYLPIDPDGIKERNSFICKDAVLKVILCDKALVNQPFNEGIDFIDISLPDCYHNDIQNLPHTTTGFNIAYVIYTSGTTGTPKGVLITHYSLINFVNSFYNQFSVQASDVFLQMSSFFFDASIMELFVPVTFGASVVFMETSMHKYPEKICDAIVKYNVNMLFFTPAMLQVFLDYLISFGNEITKLKSLKRVITGGDTLSPKLANLFNNTLYKRTQAVLTNIYGPTEATVWVTTWDCNSDTELTHIPIGKPVQNTEIYIVDENNNITENGKPGELIIGGTPVAAGYLNRAELNEEKFINNPWRSGEKMYKTGDKAQYLTDGNIAFLGRMDNQVKLNGFRVELGEVESAVLKNSRIKECVVLMKTFAEVNELVAYFTVIKDTVDEPAFIIELFDDLKLHLPDYMIPAFYRKLDTFPVNSNGKIDKKNLTLDVVRYQKTKQQFTSSSTETEKKLATIFQEQLKIEKVGIDDNLFELGVRSLIVTKIIIEVNTVLDTKINLSQFFQLPTIRELADYVDHQSVKESNPFILIRDGQGPPLFLLPGSNGNPLNYSAFIKNYTFDQPIYSIVFEETETPTIKDPQYYNNFQDYAHYLVSQIKLIQPKDPYHLLGFSFGGYIAFEIVTQLQKSNHKVGLFAVVSSMPPLYLNSLSARYFFFRELDLVINLKYYLIAKYMHYRMPFIIGEIKSKLPRLFSKNLSSNKRHIKTTAFSPIYFYESASKYKGDMILIYENLDKSLFTDFAHDDYYLTRLQPKLWKNNIAGNIKTYTIDCMHLELLTEPFVKVITEVVTGYFQKKSII